MYILPETYFFNNYIECLGNQTINIEETYKIKYYCFDKTFNETIKNMLDDYGRIYLKNKLDEIVKTNKINGYLPKSKIVTYNSEELLESEFCYEQNFNIPCSSKIFSENEHNNSWITKDYNWSPAPSSFEKYQDYWTTKYKISSGYDSAEYNIYRIPKTKTVEELTVLSGTNVELELNNTQHGIGGIWLSLIDNDDKEIPMVYYNLGKNYYLNGGQLHLEWHPKGIIFIQ